MAEMEKSVGNIEGKTWEQLDSSQKVDYSNKTKAKAAVMLIQVTHLLEEKNFEKAKDLLVQIADSCMFIKEPDQQILKWIEISCSYLAVLHKSSTKKHKSGSYNKLSSSRFLRSFIVLKYNKFSGEFEPDEAAEGQIGKEALQYISKINMILFGCQNVENNHSLYVVLTSYWLAFAIALVLLVLSFVFLISEDFFPTSSSDSSFTIQVPSVIIGCLLVLPLVMIFVKSLEQKDNNFFEKKLGEEIKKINMDCKERKVDLQFMMPHGGEINIKIGPSQKEPSLAENMEADEMGETPEEEFMDRIKGLTKEMSKMSGAEISSIKI